jgi:carbon monoxide dehydrogenase subunit G
MEMKGERLLGTDRDTAWGLLNNVDALKISVPGCESMTMSGEHGYEVVMTAAVGPVRARFKGKAVRADVEPPRRYRLDFEGQSPQAGFVRGQVRVELEAVNSGQTRLRYAATVQVGGKLAQIGSRLVDAAAAATAEKFFASFAAQIPAAPAAANFAPAHPGTPVSPGSCRWLLTFIRHLLARRT